MPITLRTQQLQREIDAQLRTIVDAQTRDLVRAWAEAWDETVADLRDALVEQLVAGERITRAQLLRSVRLARALAVVAERLTVLAQQAGVRIVSDLQAVLDVTGGAQASIIDSQLPPGAEQLIGLDLWTRVDAEAIAAIVARTTQQVTALTRPLPAETYAVVRRELIRGVVTGSNPRATAARMVDRAERGFNGGLTRALIIARTETLDASRAAAELAQAAEADLLAGWVWDADLSPRTCRACLRMHGRVFPLDQPGPQGHQQCRCARVPKTKSWAELGFDDVDEPDDLIEDAEVFFAGLTADQQRSILGVAGHAAWRRGQWPIADWAQLRSTDGWRDSWAPARPPTSPASGQSLGRRRSRAA